MQITAHASFNTQRSQNRLNSVITAKKYSMLFSVIATNNSKKLS